MKLKAIVTSAFVLAGFGHLHAQSALNPFPSRVLGQLQVEIPVRTSAPNIAVGKELNSPFGVAIDRRSTPPAIYVADTGNNRVMVWRNATNFRNGANADFVIGQTDFTSTSAGGPGTGRTLGLNAPVALVVDNDGNLYVSDNGNNRILRYRQPLEDQSEQRIPDLVIGQTSLNGRNPNAEGLSATTLNLSSGGALGLNTMIFDASGNLWVSDSLNNRVLRYSAASLNAGRNGPAADRVVGQADFTTAALPAEFNNRNREGLQAPSGLAFDSAGRLYVADAQNRVLVFPPPVQNGGRALRIVGIPVAVPQGQAPLLEYALVGPEGILIVNDNLIVVDRGLHRIVRYDPFDTWAPETPEPPPGSNQQVTIILSPPAKAVLGQETLQSFRANRGLGDPSPQSLNLPSAIAFHNNEFYVADTENNRVLVMPATVAPTTVATRVLGQETFDTGAVNFLEGREVHLFDSAQSRNLVGRDGAGVTVDLTSPTPYLYIADTFNNRILGYRDSRRVRPGDRADIVIGQSDFSRSSINSPSGQVDQPQELGLYHPSGVAVDRNGDLWVADSGNGRILRFAKPFEQTGRIRPNLVLGQRDFNTRITDVSARNMAYPFGLAFDSQGNLLASDVAHNRVLLFRRSATGPDFVTFQAAERVIGQPDLVTVTQNPNALNRLTNPRGIAVDSDDRLYVVDNSNRLFVYNRVNLTPNNPAPALTVGGLSSPNGVWVNPVTGEIWVADTGSNRAVRFPQYDRLVLNQNPDSSIAMSAPLALAQDSAGALYSAEAVNRIGIYYNGIAILNTANSADRALAPGQIGSIYPQSQTFGFGEQTAAFSSLPLPKTLGGLQVLVNERPAPLYYVSPTQINFLVPNDTPSNGIAEYQVIRSETGGILAVGQILMASANPGLFVQGSAAGGQLSALNPDNTANTPTNAIARGEVIQLFGTGQGFVPGAPPDGEAATGPVETPSKPRVIIGTDFVPDENVIYSGLAPGLPGVWQINVRVPSTVLPATTVLVAVVLENVPSNRTRGGAIIQTTISVRQ
jgi:uncharacterized protein (TIGR03437 family)